MKIKVGCRGIRVESEKESSECHSVVLINDEIEDKNPTMKIGGTSPVQSRPNKRKPDAMLDARKEKRRKMDGSVKQQCHIILKELMIHKHGWPFNQPVDPVAYNIPDYFSIITKPMDLGTIKSKLESNGYFSADDFAADVRLTFSNCMLYNPPHNEFHCMAKELNSVFDRRWKLLRLKSNLESKNVVQTCISNGQGGQQVLQPCHKLCISRDGSTNIKKMSLEEKQSLRNELKQLLKGKMTAKLQNTLKKYNLCSLKERIDLDIDAIDDRILFELKAMMKSSFNSVAAKVPAEKAVNCGCPLPKKVVDSGFDRGSRISKGSAHAKPPMASADSKCGSCGNLACQCSRQISKTLSSSTGLGSIREHGNEGSGFSVGGSAGMSDKDWSPSVDIQLSPKKALRAAMLKSRFSDTIFKAKQKALQDHGEVVDLEKLQLEKERLEKQQRKEKAMIEAHIIASEAAARLRAEAELRKQRERDRESARIALQQMEKTVEIDENLKFLKDLEMLSQIPTSGNHVSHGPYMAVLVMDDGHWRNPLERLGLYIKEDFMEDVEGESFLNGEEEEGEITC